MDLKIKDVAELLSISPTTVRRWLGEGKIPAYRLNGQYRFSRSEIEDWVLKQKMGFKEEETPAPGNNQFSLYRALYRGDCLSLPGSSKQEVIAGAMHHMADRFELDKEVLTELFLEREELMPTALGEGIGVPHTRDFLLNTHFDVILIVYPEQPLDYGALDGQLVHTLFCLFACDDKRHLHLLAKIAHLVSSDKVRAFLRTKPSKERLLEYVKHWESAIKS